MIARLEDNRCATLEAMLTMHEAFQRYFSHNQISIIPAEGYEDIWEKERACCAAIREKIREVRYEKEGAVNRE